MDKQGTQGRAHKVKQLGRAQKTVEQLMYGLVLAILCYVVWPVLVDGEPSWWLIGLVVGALAMVGINE